MGALVCAWMYVSGFDGALVDGCVSGEDLVRLVDG